MDQFSQVSVVGLPQPKTWDDYEKGCVLTFRGGHDGKEAEAFVHGMRTVFNLLRREFPPAEDIRSMHRMNQISDELSEEIEPTLEHALIRWSVVHRRWHGFSSGHMPSLSAFLAGWMCRVVQASEPIDLGKYRDSWRAGWEEANTTIVILTREHEIRERNRK